MIPPSSMVLFSTGKKYSNLGTRVVVPCNSHNKRDGLFSFFVDRALRKKRVINVMMIILKGVQKKARKLINGNVQPPHCASDNNICHFTRKEKENLENLTRIQIEIDPFQILGHTIFFEIHLALSCGCRNCCKT